MLSKISCNILMFLHIKVYDSNEIKNDEENNNQCGDETKGVKCDASTAFASI